MGRRGGSLVKEANLVEAIAGRMRTDPSFDLKSSAPTPAAERSEDMKEMLAAMQKADDESRLYEFVNTVDQEEMTVNIKVPPNTAKKDVNVKLTATTIKVEVEGLEPMKCIIDGKLF